MVLGANVGSNPLAVWSWASDSVSQKVLLGGVTDWYTRLQKHPQRERARPDPDGRKEGNRYRTHPCRKPPTGYHSGCGTEMGQETRGGGKGIWDNLGKYNHESNNWPPSARLDPALLRSGLLLGLVGKTNVGSSWLRRKQGGHAYQTCFLEAFTVIWNLHGRLVLKPELWNPYELLKTIISPFHPALCPTPLYPRIAPGLVPLL